MSHDPDRHARRSIRLRGYDYAQPGAYFITVCVRNRECALGDIVEASVGAHGGAPISDDRDNMVRMELSPYGRIVADAWDRSEDMRDEIELDAFIVMPNHIHGVVIIRNGRAHRRAPLPSDTYHRKPRSLGSFIAGFKTATTIRINATRGTPGQPFWQRNYYERVIRTEAALARAREYIAMNPRQWHLDQEHPRNR